MSRWLGIAIRVLGTAAGLTWIAMHIDLEAATAALGRIPIATFAVAIALVAANVVAGALRWRVLLSAYGATQIPPVGRLIYLYFVAFFYNNYLPGAVAGDVGRGIVTRDAFEVNEPAGESDVARGSSSTPRELDVARATSGTTGVAASGGSAPISPESDGARAASGTTGALAVVLVERALGLFALFALLAVGLGIAGDSIDAGALWWWTAIGVAGSCVLVAGIPLARKLAPWLPGPLGRIARRLPALVDGRAFVGAIGLSVVTQALIAIAGWTLLAALGPIGLGASLLVVPLAAATTFLPITVGGAGAREAVYVALCGRLFGMPEADALAASLGLWLAHLAVGGAGGLLQLAGRRRPR